MQCERGNQRKRQRQVWYEECASPVLHSFQKFDIVRLYWRPRIRYYKVQRTNGRHDCNCVRFQALRGGEEPVLWRICRGSGWAEASFELGFVMPFFFPNKRGKETPLVMHVVMLRWKFRVISPQAVLIISTVDMTSLRSLWALKESSSQASPRGGAESDFEAPDAMPFLGWRRKGSAGSSSSCFFPCFLLLSEPFTVKEETSCYPLRSTATVRDP